MDTQTIVARLHAKWVSDPKDNGDYVLNLNAGETRVFFAELEYAMATAEIRKSQSAPHYETGAIGVLPENQPATKPSVAFGPRRP